MAPPPESLLGCELEARFYLPEGEVGVTGGMLWGILVQRKMDLVLKGNCYVNHTIENIRVYEDSISWYTSITP